MFFKMQDVYTFPAIFDYAKDGISIEFPDLPGVLTCGWNNSEAVYMATDALSLRLFSDETDGSQIPAPSNVLEIKQQLQDNQIVSLIWVYMPQARKRLNKIGSSKHLLFKHDDKTGKIVIPNLGDKTLPETLSGNIIKFAKISIKEL